MEELKQWYALRVQNNFGAKIAFSLARKGLETFFPVTVENHKWTDRTKPVRVPLFPGYIFARINGPLRERVIMTPHVLQIVGKDRGEPIADTIIHSIRTIVAAPIICSTGAILYEGQTVKIKQGPLAGVEGILVRQKNEYQLVVNVAILGRHLMVVLDDDTVRSL